jgi:pentatricopeptide repeat protein
MYAKCGSMEGAWGVFNKLQSQDVVTWTSMILGDGQRWKVLELFWQMQQEGLWPDATTFVGVLNACASIVALEEGRYVHEQIIESSDESVAFLGNSLVDMYAKCGNIADVRSMFNKLLSHDVVLWNAMILGHVKCGQGYKALEPQMQQEGVQPDPMTSVAMLNACASVVSLDEGRCVHEQIIDSSCESDDFVRSSLVDMYAKCGSMEDAQRAFNRMSSQNVVMWNAIIRGYGMLRKLFNILNRCVKKVYNQMISLFVCLQSQQTNNLLSWIDRF